MTTIIGNENNPATLKLVLANNVSEKKCPLKITGHNGMSSHQKTVFYIAST